MSVAETISSKYPFVPSDLLYLLDAAIAYYKTQHPSQSVVISVTEGTEGSTDASETPEIKITIPSGSGGKVSVSDAYSANGEKNTFLTYDKEAALVHELGHAILVLIEATGASELNIAVLKAATDEAIAKVGKSNPIQFIEYMRNIYNSTDASEDTGYSEEIIWTQNKKLTIVSKSSSASYENYYNT